MNLTRRGFLGALLVAPIAAALPRTEPEYILGIRRAGEMTFTINYQEGDTWICSGWVTDDGRLVESYEGS